MLADLPLLGLLALALIARAGSSGVPTESTSVLSGDYDEDGDVDLGVVGQTILVFTSRLGDPH